MGIKVTYKDGKEEHYDKATNSEVENEWLTLQDAEEENIVRINSSEVRKIEWQ